MDAVFRGKSINAIVNILMADLVQGIRRFIRFGTVGALATVVYYGLLWTMVEIFAISILVASSAAFIFVTIENYILHYTWTFRSSNAHAEAFPRFLLMNIVGFGINWIVMFAGVQVAGFNYLWVQAFAIAIVVAWNLALSHLWIFRAAKT
jgi:putative flippase GtrA